MFIILKIINNLLGVRERYKNKMVSFIEQGMNYLIFFSVAAQMSKDNMRRITSQFNPLVEKYFLGIVSKESNKITTYLLLN